MWDLRGALLKKQEVETARLAEFEFRQRARTMRLLAAALGLNPQQLVQAIARQGDEAILAELSQAEDIPTAKLLEHFEAARALARAQLVAELGDPSPHRLA